MTYPSQRGRIQPPDLDDRTWQDLVNECKALIPRYAPQWTDHNPSDLGISLIELFAWLVEGLIYRLNRVPDKNYLAVLNVLGVTRNPPTPAMTYLTFTQAAPERPAGPGRGAPLVVPAGAQFQSQPSQSQRAIVFETDDDARVWPLNLASAVILQGPKAAQRTAELVGPPTADVTLTLGPGVVTQVCLGFTLPEGWTAEDASRLSTMAIRVEFVRPAAVDASVRLECCYSATDVTDPADWPSRYTAADGTTRDLAADGTGNLHANGTVKFDAPPNWSAQRAAAPRPPGDGDPPVWTNVTDAPATAPLFWLGLRITATDSATVIIGRVLFNSVSAHNALTIATPEQIGTSTGEPFQVWQLAHFPLYAPFGTDTAPPDLVVEIEPPPGPGQAASRSTWKQVDDLPAGAAEVYRCNPVTAEILFGDHDPTTAGDTGHGTVPPQGATIWASRYRYVAAGTDGNVAPGTINTATTKLLDGQARPVNVTVTNLGPGFGGSDEEPVEDTLRRAPDMLRTHDRAVTASDYETLALRSTTDVVKTRCLTPKTFETTVTDAGGAVVARPGKPWLFGGLDRSPGNVNVIVVPDQGPDQPRPAPTQQLLTEVQGYLAGRCALTASVRVCGPLYLPIKVIAEVAFWDSVPDTVRSRVLDDTRAKIARVLHPTRGGVDGRGWQPGQSVFVSDLFGPIMPPADTGYITVLQVMPETPAYLPPGATPTLADRPVPLPTAGASFVEVCDYELVCPADSTDVKEASDA